MIYDYEIEDKKIKGVIKVELLPWRERMKKVKEILYKIVDGVAISRDELEQGELTIECALERIKEVKLMIAGKKIDSVDELMFYKEGIEIANKLSNIILQGVSISKN